MKDQIPLFGYFSDLLLCLGVPFQVRLSAPNPRVAVDYPLLSFTQRDILHSRQMQGKFLSEPIKGI